MNQYATQTPVSGTGLGLYLAYSYCKMMKWELTLQTGENGTTANVLIPLTEPDWQQVNLKSSSSTLGVDAQKQRIQAELCMWQAQKQCITE